MSASSCSKQFVCLPLLRMSAMRLSSGGGRWYGVEAQSFDVGTCLLSVAQSGLEVHCYGAGGAGGLSGVTFRCGCVIFRCGGSVPLLGDANVLVGKVRHYGVGTWHSGVGV